MTEDSEGEKLENPTEFNLEHWSLYTQQKALLLSIIFGLLGWALLDDFYDATFVALAGFCCFMIAKWESKQFVAGGPMWERHLIEYQKFVENKEEMEKYAAEQAEKEAVKRERWYASKTNKFLNYVLGFYFLLLLFILITAGITQMM